jgi:hypothetical protein
LAESSCAQAGYGQAARCTPTSNGQAGIVNMIRLCKQLGHQGCAFACFTNPTQHCRSTLPVRTSQ